MKFQKPYFLIFILLCFISCKENHNTEIIEFVESEDFIKETIEIEIIEAPESESLSMYGELTKEEINRYYPKLLDTTTNIHIVGAEKLEMNINENIIVSMLYNSATFEERILCTHDKKQNLIDNYYIGKSTMFDETSHVINYKITDKNKIKFTHVDYGYINEEDIDTINHYNYTLFIDNQGKIIKK